MLSAYRLYERVPVLATHYIRSKNSERPVPKLTAPLLLTIAKSYVY
jgi:hypothetical protein